jgi:ketosteroid isomerase-like protein
MTPEEIVKQWEAAFQAQDIELVKDLFDPEVVVYHNGKKLFEGREQFIEFEKKVIDSWKNYKTKHTLRAASGDTIAFEFEISATLLEDETQVEIYGAEFWKMLNNRAVEVSSYHKGYTVE